MFTLADHLLAVIVGVVVPVASARSGRDASLRMAMATDPEVRRAVVQQSAALQWLMCGLVMGATWLRGADVDALGLSPRGVEPGLAIAFVLALVGALALIVRGQVILRNPWRRQRTLAKSAAAAPFLPRTRAEQRGWVWLSVTAGFCEEVIFRGFLLAYGLAWATGEFGPPSPDQPAAWAAAVFVSLAFGASHLYQGRTEALKVVVFGSSLAFLYVLSGSIWPSILLHVFVDIHEGWLWTRALQAEGEELLAIHGIGGTQDAPRAAADDE